MVHVESNAHGLWGLYLATDAFSEEVERRLFKNRSLFGSSENEATIAASKTRSGTNARDPQILGWTRDIWKLCRLIRDIFGADNLNVPGASDVVPDYVLPLSYPDGASFPHHYDSRYRWGEAIIGVSLGQESNIYFLRKGHPKVTVTLPRRSIYVMTGECRLEWKHGIQKQNVKKLQNKPPPSWNPHNIRRSLTLRATKAHSDAFLQHLLLTTTQKNATTNHPSSAYRQRLEARIRQQNKFPPRLEAKKLNAQELAMARQHAQATLQFVLNSPRLEASFDDADDDDDDGADDDDDDIGIGGGGGVAHGGAVGFMEMMQQMGAAMGGGGGGVASGGAAGVMEMMQQIGATMGGAGAGPGYRLGDGSENRDNNHNHHHENDDAQLQAAIQASLREHQHHGGRSEEQQQPAQEQDHDEDDDDDDDADPQAAIRLSLMQDQDAKQQQNSKKSAPAAAAAAAAAAAPAESISLLSDDDDDDDDGKVASKATINDDKSDANAANSNQKKKREDSFDDDKKMKKSKPTINEASSEEKPATATATDIRAKRLLRFENNNNNK